MPPRRGGPDPCGPRAPVTLKTSATVSLTLTLAGGTLSLTGWILPAALVAVAWVGELAVQARAMRAGR